MNNFSMTALVSCFARAYHSKNSKVKVYNDKNAIKIITDEEYNSISTEMKNGISFFNPNFSGSESNALDLIVNTQLAPSVLARSAFCERALLNSVKIGANQYVVLASGYDTSIYNSYDELKNVSCFEVDTADMIIDKQRRLELGKIDYSGVNYVKCDLTKDCLSQRLIDSNYDKNKIAFFSMLGIIYYLSKNEFANILSDLFCIIKDGSSIAFDYPTYDEDAVSEKNEKLACATGEFMMSKYSYDEIEKLLSDNGFLIYEHLNSDDVTNEFFKTSKGETLCMATCAPKGVNYCLAVKKHQ